MPAAVEKIKKHSVQQEMLHLSAPTSGKKSSFCTPRYQRLVRHSNNAKHTTETALQHASATAPAQGDVDLPHHSQQ